MEKHRDTLLLVGRLLLGYIFLTGGWSKITNLEGFAAGLAKNGVPMPGPLALVGAVVELFGGLAVVLGFQARWAALMLLLFTVIASLISHRYWEFADAARRMQQTQFNKNLAIIGGFLFLALTGAGRFSVDALLRRKK